MRTLLVATTNRDKVREVREILNGTPFDLVTLADYPPVAAPEETGRTFEDNAQLKALYYAAATGALTVAEDSGLEVDPLGGAPGVESARYGGAALSYPDKFDRLYRELTASGAAPEAWTARFVCAVCLVDGGVVRFAARGTVEGRVAREPAGQGGFGYDPIFFYPPFGATLAEAGARKSTVSHRGAAFRALRAFLEGAPRSPAASR